MRIDILLFGPQAKLAQTDRVTVDLQTSPTVAEALSVIGKTMPELAPTLAVSRLAVNHEYASDEDVLSEEDEVALIGMVSGG